MFKKLRRLFSVALVLSMLTHGGEIGALGKNDLILGAPLLRRAVLVRSGLGGGRGVVGPRGVVCAAAA